MIADAIDSIGLLVDTSPLIYLAKIDALDILGAHGRPGITPGVRDEAIAPPVAYRFPEAVAIEAAVADSWLEVVAMTPDEEARTAVIGHQVPGLGCGEREVIAVAVVRERRALLFDRRAMRIASALGVEVADIFELLFAATPDSQLLEDRVRRLGPLVGLRLETFDALLQRVERAT